MVTMLDVARSAGVSKATVSRVLNGRNVVADAVRERVLQAIAETGYRPNLLARQMATQKTSLIGLVMSSELYDGPWFASMMSGAATRINQSQHQLIFADSKYSADEEREAIDYLLRMRCAGVVIYPEYLSVDELDRLAASSPVPVCVLNRRLPRHPANSVWIDHAHAGQAMMAYLLEQGHRQIAFIAGKAHSWSNGFREAAWRRALVQHGVDPDARRAQGDWTMDSGYRAMQQLLAEPTPFSAVLAANDDMAAGALRALAEAGLQVPADLSVAGFDDAKMGRYLTPALTTLHVPVVEMVEQAIAQLLGEAEAGQAALRGALVVRESVGPPGRGGHPSAHR
ncbi:LacI family DNA-binding transcriptional regulator [Pantoea sp. 1.19]|uniref:LacI family DNA-binding transcriptional regulator n=1 Tax=Pantoea sp. 1.19 TaxID=1925589 RepID=UPI0009489212|nr:LacI family DNA-binding transcriptional regulator [Pantoea sp. 1.19]